ncbi:clostridium P-47 protein-domain-containing protein [Fusarium avenaceum]|nr:clostridium P-47 protein-domain-containing protein [Fusarium avenaceum]
MSTISTYGWDMVFATTYANIDAQIAAQCGPSHENYLFSLSPSIYADLQFGTWQFAQGGNGQTINLKIPITTGVFHGASGVHNLGGQSIIIGVSLKWVAEPGPIQFSISNNIFMLQSDLNVSPTATNDVIQAFAANNVTLSPSATVMVVIDQFSWKITDLPQGRSFYVYSNTSDTLLQVQQYAINKLVVNTQSVTNPVTVISAGSISDTTDASNFKELVNNSINMIVSSYQFAFATVYSLPQSAQPATLTWLQPTSSEYAVVEPVDPAPDNCVFAILSMVNNNVNTNPIFQVDTSIIPPTCTSGLLISPTMFLNNLLAPSMYKLFIQSNQSDFTVDESTLSINNTATIAWANIRMDSTQGMVLGVNAGDFSMSVENDRITMSISNQNYPINTDPATVVQTDFNFTGQFQLLLEQGKGSKKVLWFRVPADQPGTTDVSVAMNQSNHGKDNMIIGLINGLFWINIDPDDCDSLAHKAVKAKTTNTGMVKADATAAGIQSVLQGYLSDPHSQVKFVEQASSAAVKMFFGAPVDIGEARIWASVAKFCANLLLLTSPLGGGQEYVLSALQAAAKSGWEDFPPFNNFANTATSGFSFGGLSEFKLEVVNLAASFQIGFTSA